MAMRGGGVPDGFDPNASVIQLTPTANHVPIVDMKGGDDTLPMAAAATVVLAPGVVGPSTKTLMIPIVKTPGKPIQIILFGKTFDAFSTTVDAASQPILAPLGDLTNAEKSDALHEIYDGIVNLRTITLDKYPYLKRLLIRMGIDYAKEKKELMEEPIHLEQTEIKLAFPNGKVEVTLIIKCEQLPSCSQKNLPMAAAATIMTQKGGDGEQTIKLFGKDYKFPNRPKTINGHEDLLEELEVKDKGDSFKITLLDEIYDGCYTDGSIISKIKCSTFGTLLEELGQKYALKVHDLLRLNITPQKKGDLIKQKKSPNGDLEFTFTFSNFGKEIGEETKKKIKAASEKAASSNGFFTKLIADPVSSNQVSVRGMTNPKNACFCISSIQLLFSIPQIRTIMKEYGRTKCNDTMLAEIYSQIEHPITTVNNEGVLCALFHLFEELGENMTLFSKLEAGTIDKNAVPYELLGYIMKNFEISRKGTNNDAYQVGDQEDVELFLTTFLFGIFNEKEIKIQPLFQFTQKTIAATRVEDESHSNVWIIHDNFSASYDDTRTIQEITENYSVTLTLENNPYLLLRPSDPNANLSGMSHTLSIQKGKDNKEFKLYGMIRKSGDPESGHYVYDRQDLTSEKHILYSDSDVTLDNKKIQMRDGAFNVYLLVYAEVESPVKAPEKSVSAASDLASAAPVKSVAPPASDLASAAPEKSVSTASDLASAAPVKSVAPPASDLASAAPVKSVALPASKSASVSTAKPKESIATQLSLLNNDQVENMIRDLLTNTYTIDQLEINYGGRDACKPLWLEARKVAEKNSSKPLWMFVLGICNLYGRGGIDKNNTIGAGLLRGAADNGLAAARTKLGHIYADKNQYSVAIPLWQSAEAQGDAEAQYQLGLVYSTSVYLPKNIETARKLFQAAAKQGHQEAQSALNSEKTSTDFTGSLLTTLKANKAKGANGAKAGGTRTLRASKQSPKKKRTLRASKKLRQSSNKA